MLAQPFLAANTEEQKNEKIIIIDASASMRSVRSDDVSRFDYAVSQVNSLAEEFLAQGGLLTVIIAGQDASVVIAPRLGEDSLTELTNELKSIECTYGDGDIDVAIDLAEETLRSNTRAEVVMYTGTQYIDKGDITVVDVSQDGEWNVAILNCTAELSENVYNFTVDLACYGRDTYVMLYCDVYGVGDEKQTVNMSTYVKCSDDKTQVVEFNTVNDDGVTRISSYEYVYIHVEENDSFAYDNSFYLYGGERETIKIEYCSTKANVFFESILFRLRSWFSSTMSIEIKEVQDGKAILEGFDLYIFEHTMPEVVPQDGIVLLVNPDKAPEGVDIVLGESVTGEFALALGFQHPVIDYVYPERIQITEYKRIITSDGFDTLMYCGGDPVFLLKNEVDSKIGIL
ncbi:MAG: VWA domain-containing protein, partial [Clostridiales bacterium]|nr:VWA domain-containing protein [Clostridiales bacterium]